MTTYWSTKYFIRFLIFRLYIEKPIFKLKFYFIKLKSSQFYFMQLKSEVKWKKSPASIAGFPTINQQLENWKYHLHLPSLTHHHQIQSILPHHSTEEKTGKINKEEDVIQKSSRKRKVWEKEIFQMMQEKSRTLAGSLQIVRRDQFNSLFSGWKHEKNRPSRLVK